MSNSFFEKVGTAVRGQQGIHFAVSSEPESPPDAARIVSGVSRWCSGEDKYWGAAQTHAGLPAGIYKCGIANGIGPYLELILNQTDDILDLPDSVTEEVVAEIRQFSGLKPAFDLRGFLYKRGILLWGPPGSGKTCTLQILMRIVVQDMGGIAVLVDHPEVASECLHLVRKIEPKRQIIAVMEDLDALIERFGENKYLALLDGEAQVDNIICVATTNYPERLDRRFVDRPSRFDTIKYVGMPSSAARRAYLSAKEKTLGDGELTSFVRDTDGMSIAHLRELIILTKCFGRPRTLRHLVNCDRAWVILAEQDVVYQQSHQWLTVEFDITTTSTSWHSTRASSRSISLLTPSQSVNSGRLSITMGRRFNALS